MIFDPIFLLIMAVTAGLSGIAAFRVKRAFAKYKKIPLRSGVSGAQIAQKILEAEGIYDVGIERVAGTLSDHYDPRSKTLRLSADVYDGRSVAAAGVAAHEVGHALQHAKAYGPLKMRSWLAPKAGLGSKLSMLVIVGGLAVQATGLVYVGIALFSLMTAFVLVTLPVEFDASKRAKRLLPALGFTQGDENAGVEAVLSAAAMTYVAAAAGSVAQLIYWLGRAGILSSRD